MKLVVGEAPLGAGLVVDAVAEGQQAEPLDPARGAVEAGHRLGEPAERAGREPAEDDAGLPGFAQDLVDPVRPPDAEQADHAAAADVDQVLGEQVLAQVLGPLLAAEEGDVAGLAAIGREGAVEADDVVVGVAAGRGQEADARAARPRSGRARSRRAAGCRTPSRSRRRRRPRSDGVSPLPNGGGDALGPSLYSGPKFTSIRSPVCTGGQACENEEKRSSGGTDGLAQLVAHAVQPDLDSSFRDPELVSDRGVGQILAVAKGQ